MVHSIGTAARKPFENHLPMGFAVISAPMRTRHFQTFAQRHLAWLLWLVLLLPVAQLAALSHLVSHGASSQTEPRDGHQAIGQGHCDVCLGAQALVGGAPLVAAAALLLAFGLTQATVLRPCVRLLPARLIAYNSRAPPIFQH